MEEGDHTWSPRVSEMEEKWERYFGPHVYVSRSVYWHPIHA